MTGEEKTAFEVLGNAIERLSAIRPMTDAELVAMEQQEQDELAALRRENERLKADVARLNAALRDREETR